MNYIQSQNANKYIHFFMNIYIFDKSPTQIANK